MIPWDPQDATPELTEVSKQNTNKIFIAVKSDNHWTFRPIYIMIITYLLWELNGRCFPKWIIHILGASENITEIHSTMEYKFPQNCFWKLHFIAQSICVLCQIIPFLMCKYRQYFCILNVFNFLLCNSKICQYNTQSLYYLKPIMQRANDVH